MTQPIAFYLDLDGVFADYEAGIRRLGFHPDPALAKKLNRSGTDNPLKRQMHEAIKGTDFYRRLPLLPGSLAIFNAVYDTEPTIVTAAPRFGADAGGAYLIDPYWLGAAYNKRLWVEETLLPQAMQEAAGERMIFIDMASRLSIPDDKFVCTTSSRKQEFMHRQKAPIQVLIDDRIQNCEAWAAAGGIAILHDDVAETLRAIDMIRKTPAALLRPHVRVSPAYLDKHELEPVA